MDDIGDRVEVSVTFRDTEGVLTDPTAVTLRILKPDGTVTVVTQGSLTHTSTGVWTYGIDVDQAGTWRYRYEGTGALVAAEEDSFKIRARRVPAS